MHTKVENTCRNQFLTFLIKNCSGLNYALLKYIYDDITQLPESLPLVMLIDRDDYSALLYVISTAKNISKIKTKKSLHAQIITLKFSDYSFLVIKIKVSFQHQGVIYMNADDILLSVAPNKENIKTPAPSYQFEYILLSGMLNKMDMEDSYREYFGKMTFDVRSKIFAHIRQRYNLVLNVLDDLYSFNKNYYRKIRKTLNSEKQNSGWRFARNILDLSFAFVSRNIANGFDRISFRNSRSVSKSTGPLELSNYLERKSILRIL